jgi:hypothetical protein
VGAVAWLVFADEAVRSSVSYLGGLAFAGLLFTCSIAAVRWAGQSTPEMTTVVAVMTYAMTVVILAALFATLSPRVVNTSALASGLVAAVVVWVAEQMRAAQPGAGS